MDRSSRAGDVDVDVEIEAWVPPAHEEDEQPEPSNAEIAVTLSRPSPPSAIETFCSATLSALGGLARSLVSTFVAEEVAGLAVTALQAARQAAGDDVNEASLLVDGAILIYAGVRAGECIAAATGHAWARHTGPVVSMVGPLLSCFSSHDAAFDIFGRIVSGYTCYWLESATDKALGESVPIDAKGEPLPRKEAFERVARPAALMAIVPNAGMAAAGQVSLKNAIGSNGARLDIATDGVSLEESLTGKAQAAGASAVVRAGYKVVKEYAKAIAAGAAGGGLRHERRGFCETVATNIREGKAWRGARDRGSLRVALGGANEFFNALAPHTAAASKARLYVQVSTGVFAAVVEGRDTIIEHSGAADARGRDSPVSPAALGSGLAAGLLTGGTAGYLVAREHGAAAGAAVALAASAVSAIGAGEAVARRLKGDRPPAQNAEPVLEMV